MQLPVLRSLIRPDPGHTLLDLDLTAADAQVVAWSANDAALKARFRSGADIHLENARDLWGQHLTVDSTDARGVRYRDKAKLVHAINYLCGWQTLASHLRDTPAVAKQFITHWFKAHPEIPAWHKRLQWDIETKREIRNAWGFRRIYTDRPDYILPQACAWIGQSTVAITINKILLRVDHAAEHEGFPCQILLQVHDNLIMQCPTPLVEMVARQLLVLAAVPIPFDDPLIIPAALKISDKSWADVHPWCKPCAMSATG